MPSKANSTYSPRQKLIRLYYKNILESPMRNQAVKAEADKVCLEARRCTRQVLRIRNRHDDALLESFHTHFPEFKDEQRIAKITDDDLKTASQKHKWRTFMKEWEKSIGASMLVGYDL